MMESTIKDDWVGTAGRRCDSTVQKRIIARVFGENIARSVQRIGEHHIDGNARELGMQVVNTAQTSGDFRDMLRMLVPSAQEALSDDNSTGRTTQRHRRVSGRDNRAPIRA